MRKLLSIVSFLVSFAYAQVTMSPLDSVRPISNAIPLEQIMGDLDQLLNNSYDAGANTFGFWSQGIYASTYGVWGTDACPSTLLPTNDIFSICGDTQEVYYDSTIADCGLSSPNTVCVLNFKTSNTGNNSNNGQITGGTSPNSGLKSMYVFKNSGGNVADFTSCKAIFGVDGGLTAGNTPAPDYTGCPNPVYLTNSTHTATQPKAASQNISGLGSSADSVAEGIDNGNVPSDVFVANGHVYVIWAVTRLGVGDNRLGDSVLMDCGATTVITGTSPGFDLGAELACTRAYVWSQAPSVGTIGQNGAIAGNFTGSSGSGAITATSGTFPAYICCDADGNGLIFVDETNSREYRVTARTDSTHITVTPVLVNNCGGGCIYSGMQKQQTNIGKFLTASVECDAVASLSASIKNALPAPLQAAANVCFVWGSDWTRNQGNLYLLAIDATLIPGSTCATAPGGVCYTYTTDGSGFRENGTSGGLTQAYYLTALSSTGSPTWKLGEEQSAIPLFTTFNHVAGNKLCQTYHSPTCPGGDLDVGVGVQKPSVVYHSLLSRWVATYSSTNTNSDVQLRTSSTPWGPWSGENKIESVSANLNRWGGKMYTNAGGPNFNFNAPNNSVASTTGVKCDGTGGTPSAQGGLCQMTMYQAPQVAAAALTSVANSSGGSAVYTGTMIQGNNNGYQGYTFTVAGFPTGANNGTFLCSASTATTATLANASASAESHAATATQVPPYIIDDSTASSFLAGNGAWVYPLQLPSVTDHDNGNNTVTIYFTLSQQNPYTPEVMSVIMAKSLETTVVGNVKVSGNTNIK